MTFPILGANSAVGGYAIDNSLRFNDNDSAYLNRTPASASNRTTWTWSAWIKRSAISTGNYQTLWNAGSGEADDIRLSITNSDQIIFGTDATVFLLTSQLFRDVSAWYHIVFAFDTTQGTASDRAKLYINGSLVSSFSTDNRASLSGSYAYNNTVGHAIGRQAYAGSTYYDGYMAEINFIDAQQLSPTDFGEFDEDSGIWKPIEYTGTYGTNGFYLDFENSGSLGADQSGNGNDFTPTNLASTDQTTDTPTNNFATWNSLDFQNGAKPTYSEGNTKAVGANGGRSFCSSMGVSSGKWYVEAKMTDVNAQYLGFVPQNYITSRPTQDSADNSISIQGTNPTLYKDGSSAGSLAGTVSDNDIIMFALDLDNSRLYIGKNGNWNDGIGGGFDQSDFSNATGHTFTQLTDAHYVIASANGSSTDSYAVLLNTGNPSFSISSGNSDDNGYGNFEYAPPSGYLALCTQNLATELSPTIDDGSQYFNTVLWSGNSVDDRSITGVGFAPDLVSIKSRNLSTNFYWYDTTRGADNQIISNATNAEQTITNKLQAFESDGFQLGTSSEVNASSYTYVGWSWKANGGTTSSNTDGDVTSTVQASTTSGFSIVSWTSTGGNESIGHGLGVVPAMFITKNRTAGANWKVYHHKNTSAPETDNLSLNKTDATQDDINAWNDTAPTSTTFTVGIDAGSGGSSGNNMVAYCFAEIEGYSKFGSGTGSGTASTNFIYTGFKPSWVMIKRTDSTDSWAIFDNKRPSYNVTPNRLFADLSNAESTSSSNQIDMVSNGFVARGTSMTWNASGSSFIYMAFAESPFVTSTGIPVTAR